MLDRPAAMEDTAEGMLANDDTIANIKPTVSEDERRGGVPVQNAGSPIDVTLENESVWSRFHSLGTEMILTKQGRRMFPCCRFRLSGLDPNVRYFLIMDIAPLDDFRHRWNGKAWERDGEGEAHLQSPVCFHPDSPALGQRWMDGPVSFYKVKLTHSSLERDAGVLLHPMHRYQPRLYVVPVSACPERVVPLEGPDVHTFTFPQTEFYAVTSYQNSQITRLKIDCNPFMLAFREDQTSARLIQSKLGLALTGRSPSQTAVSSLTAHGTRLSATRASESAEAEAVLSNRKRAACAEISGAERPVRDQSVASLGFESAEAVATLASSESPGKCDVPSSAAPLSAAGKVQRVYRRSRCMRRARKAKAKWWSNVKYARAAVVSNSATRVSMQPDLEDVDGVLFVSFTAKEALDVHVGNMRRSGEASPSSHVQNQADNTACGREARLSAADRICEHELTLLQHLKQLKNRQILHPALQQVGMKLNLLDPAASIDLHYLGLPLPLPSPALSDSDKLTPSSCEHGAPFVSRTGKTNDLTRIKGWMEKFSLNGASSAADSSANHSAFSSDVLDEYLEREGQQISERAAVFSTSTPSPVVYQLPVKSCSYVRTLDSVLQTRGLPPNKRPSKRPAKTPPVCSSSTRSTSRDHRPSASGGGAPKVFSRRGRKRRRPQLRFNREVVDGSQSSTSAKKHHAELLVHEEHAVVHGENPTYISTERGSFALNALLTTEKEAKAPQLSTRHLGEDACVKAFCRLGCVCDSLNRETRGSTHCGRVQCMFSCGCFKHKILLIRSPEISQDHNIRSLKAFHPGSDVRPEPALRITSLWKRRPDEKEPEPLCTPKAAGALRRALRSHAHTPRTAAQVETVEKDPVYLYLESMMTCARVREYNSNPPPQVHLLPAQRSSRGPGEAKTSGASLLRVPEGHQATQSPDRSSAGVNAGEPEPTKVLEIISGCNWEAHRSLVLKELFRYINTNHLSPVFFVDVYKVELLSKDLSKDQNSSTLTYKVCVSLSEKPDKQNMKKREETLHLRNPSCQNVNKPNDARANENLDFADTNAPAQHCPLLSRAVPAGCLKASKKTPRHPGPIKVNGRTYNQARLLLGRIGALHPANRLAAYVTGRIKPAPQNTIQSGSVCKTLPVRTGCSNTPAVDRSKHTATQPPATSDGIRRLNYMTSPEAGWVLNAAAPPLSGAGTVLPASALPPGQQVVLQPVAGMAGVNMCQFNGQMIQLVPVPAALPVHLQTGAGSTGTDRQEPQTATQLLQTNPIPFILPRIHSVPGRTGFTLGSAATAHGVQNALLSKTGTFSFRIWPPTAESRAASLEPPVKPQESIATASTLLLPGGYKLIKLPMLVQPSHGMNTEESTESPPEEAAGQQSSVKTGSGQTPEESGAEDGPPLVIKAEPFGRPPGDGCDRPDDGKHEETPVVVKVEPYDESSEVERQPDDSRNPNAVKAAKMEETEQEIQAGVRTSERSVTDEGTSSSSAAFSEYGPGVPSLCAQTERPQEHEQECGARAGGGRSFSKHRPVEIQNRTDRLWRGKRRALSSDGHSQAGGELSAGTDDPSAALMYSSDGWTTEDSNEWLSEDEVDIETFEESDEIIGRLREKARRKTQRAAQRQRLSAGGAARRPVRLMSDLPLYKRTWRLNQALRERKRLAELQRSLDALRTALGVEEHVTVSTDDLLRRACQTIVALEDHGRCLMARKRALIRLHSHYQTRISPRSAAGTERKAVAPSLPRGSSETTARGHSANRASRLPDVVLRSFSGIECLT